MNASFTHFFNRDRRSDDDSDLPPVRHDAETVLEDTPTRDDHRDEAQVLLDQLLVGVDESALVLLEDAGLAEREGGDEVDPVLQCHFNEALAFVQHEPDLVRLPGVRGLRGPSRDQHNSQTFGRPRFFKVTFYSSDPKSKTYFSK